MLGFYFSPFGRISRKQFWLQYVLVDFAVVVAAFVADYFLFPETRDASNGPVGNATNFLVFWPQIALTTKRFHDRGMSGWWQIAFNIVLVAGGYFAYSALLEISSNIDAQIDPDPDTLRPLLIGGGLVLVAGLAELVILGFLKGAQGTNKYGDDPLNPTRAVADVFA